MTDDARSYRDRLAELQFLAEQLPPEDRARIEHSIQLVCRALQEIARFWQQTGTQPCQSEAAGVAALGRRIVEDARKVGLRIGDNDNWQ